MIFLYAFIHMLDGDLSGTYPVSVPSVTARCVGVKCLVDCDVSPDFPLARGVGCFLGELVLYVHFPVHVHQRLQVSTSHPHITHTLWNVIIKRHRENVHFKKCMWKPLSTHFIRRSSNTHLQEQEKADKHFLELLQCVRCCHVPLFNSRLEEAALHQPCTCDVIDAETEEWRTWEKKKNRLMLIVFITGMGVLMHILIDCWLNEEWD